MRQAQAFLDGEGAAWLKRNSNKLTRECDPVLKAIEKYKIDPHIVLEVGCANGWRLTEIRKICLQAMTYGVDPSIPNDGKYHDFNLVHGTAENLDYSNGCMDLIIYGWSLYLCDPEDYLKIATDGDRVLADGGHLIVYDFHADYPYKTPYKHKKGLFSHHYDFSRLWLSHPAYSLYGRTIQETTSVTILKKDLSNAFPVQK